MVVDPERIALVCWAFEVRFEPSIGLGHPQGRAWRAAHPANIPLTTVGDDHSNEPGEGTAMRGLFALGVGLALGLAIAVILAAREHASTETTTPHGGGA
ncbi:MAG: hypothetical protein DWI58_10135 [Chloroflexi bacterium]|nr:MAG: hypothetical protein DWI58_10135 [Chloroflexota bacterium]